MDRAFHSGCGRWEGARRKCVAAYPDFLNLVGDVSSPSLRLGDGLARVWDHAVTLARKEAIQALEALPEQAQELGQDRMQARRGQIHRMLQRVSPGRSNVLAAVQRRDGSVTTNLTEMHEILQAHWRDVFQVRPPQQVILDCWLRDEHQTPGPCLPPQENTEWEV